MAQESAERDGGCGAGLGRRGVALIVVPALVAAGLVSRHLLPGIVGDVAGGVLYAVLVYTLLVAALPRASTPVVAVTALVIGWAVELLQLTGLPASLAAVLPPARLVLGTTFAVWDLVTAAIGVTLAALVDARRRRV